MSEPDQVRPAAEVAYRALALFPVVSIALGGDRTAILEWLSESGLGDRLAPSEAAFMATPKPSRQQRIHMTWMSERLIVLLWALGQVDHLPAADERCDTGLFLDILPPLGPVGLEDFVAGAKLRPEAELTAMAEATQALHWEARNAKLTEQPPRRPVTLGIIQERHHAINWITGYDNLPWDQVTTDT
jgi:hypothetical protein